MKITIVVGGRWHAFDLARELSNNGCLHMLITNYPKWFVKRWGIPEERVITLPLTFWAVKAIYKLGGEPLMMKLQWLVHSWFAKRAVKYIGDADLVHGWSQWSEHVFDIARKKGIPTVLERSSAHILEQSKILEEEYKRFGLKWSSTHKKIVAMELREYDMSNAIAVPSLFVERSFEKYGVMKQQLYRNQLGVNLDQFKPHSPGPSPPNAEEIHVIYAGAMSLRKGIIDLLRGFESLEMPKASLTLMGGSTPEVEKYIRGSSSNIRRIGHQPQDKLADYYAQSHCFVIASVEEGMAMVQLQALACGTPIICTTNSGGEDLLRLSDTESKSLGMGVTQFGAGFLIPIHSPENIALCIKKLASEPELWGKMRTNALELAKQELSWKAYGDRAIKLYKTILGKNQCQ